MCNYKQARIPPQIELRLRSKTVGPINPISYLADEKWYAPALLCCFDAEQGSHVLPCLFM